MNYDSPVEIRAAVQSMGIRLQRRWGQNFLINPQARRRIVELLAPAATDTVWEIGPGLGNLTVLLLPRVRKLVAFEVDWGLVRFLERTFSGEQKLELVQGDAVRTWKRELDSRGEPQRIIGNLPYASASALIGALAEANLRPERMVFTVQRELARRMTAVPATKAYSSFSVLCQVAYRIESSLELRAGSFYPAPEVSSTVVVLEPQERIQPPRDRELCLRLVRGLFLSRRKTLWNNLLAAGLADGEQGPAVRLALAAEGIDPGSRGETLRPEQFVRLSDRLAAEG